MSVKETPLAKMKRLHGGKEKLVDSLVDDLAKESEESKDELKQRLMSVSNSKLLRLSRIQQQVREKYGSKDKLVDAVSAAKGKSKDQDYVTKLHTYSISRLLDMAGSARAS
jgi:DNA integrity scanning protein DisA with diadenylate cyclase activity